MKFTFTEKGQRYFDELKQSLAWNDGDVGLTIREHSTMPALPILIEILALEATSIANLNWLIANKFAEKEEVKNA